MIAKGKSGGSPSCKAKTDSSVYAQCCADSVSSFGQLLHSDPDGDGVMAADGSPDNYGNPEIDEQMFRPPPSLPSAAVSAGTLDTAQKQSQENDTDSIYVNSIAHSDPSTQIPLPTVAIVGAIMFGTAFVLAAVLAFDIRTAKLWCHITSTDQCEDEEAMEAAAANPRSDQHRKPDTQHLDPYLHVEWMSSTTTPRDDLPINHSENDTSAPDAPDRVVPLNPFEMLSTVI
jgi:hypothetical protein